MEEGKLEVKVTKLETNQENIIKEIESIKKSIDNLYDLNKEAEDRSNALDRNVINLTNNVEKMNVVFQNSLDKLGIVFQSTIQDLQNNFDGISNRLEGFIKKQDEEEKDTKGRKKDLFYSTAKKILEYLAVGMLAYLLAKMNIPIKG